MGAGKCGLGGRERGIRALKMGHIYADRGKHGGRGRMLGKQKINNKLLSKLLHNWLLQKVYEGETF